MNEKFGFITRTRISVLKAYEEDAADISKLYFGFSAFQRRIIAKNWELSLKAGKYDLYKDVTFMIKDKCEKVLGIVETQSKDRINIQISIWIPNKAKEKMYLNQILESMIEWSEIDEYKRISAINLVIEVAEKIKYEELMTDIILPVA